MGLLRGQRFVKNIWGGSLIIVSEKVRRERKGKAPVGKQVLKKTSPKG